MKQPHVNPHLPTGFRERMEMSMPPDHPAVERTMLTAFQMMAMPILLWFLDPMRHRGEGRTVLMCHVMIELAKRGYRVPLEDLSRTIDTGARHYPERRYFFDKLRQIMHDHYPEDIFHFEGRQVPFGDAFISYHGRRPL